MPALNVPNTIVRKAQPVLGTPVVRLTANATLKTRQNGALVLLDSATAFTVTLPPLQNGLFFSIIVKTVAGATGHTVAIGSVGKMFGKVGPTGAAAAGTTGKGRLNTQATSVQGDALDVWCDGSNWYAIPTGTWAEQP